VVIGWYKVIVVARLVSNRLNVVKRLVFIDMCGHVNRTLAIMIYMKVTAEQ
jgi:hypothetical protein